METLPAPLPLIILKYLPDLRSLHAIRLSSPVFAAALHLHAAELFEDIMVKNISWDAAIEIRTLLHLRSREKDGIPPPTTEELEAIYKTARRPLPRSTSPIDIGNILCMFSKISSTCDVVFHKKLEHFYRLPHVHLADKRWGNWARIRKFYGIPYDLPPKSPPDWVEQ